MCRGAEMEMGVAPVPATPRWVAWATRLQKSAPQAALFLFFVVYTVAGAKSLEDSFLLESRPPVKNKTLTMTIFQALEHPEEVRSQKEAGETLVTRRRNFLDSLINLTAPSFAEYKNRVSIALETYEEAVESAVEAGVSPLDPKKPHYQWNYIESVFFASTVITTIGYGNMAPVTFWGRFFCILYGFVGIPVTLSVIADLGNLFANIVSALGRKIKTLFVQCRPATMKSPGEQQFRGLIVLGAVVSLLVYMAIGGGIFILWEDWTFFEAFYFCFITMTTIGLGDLVPARTEFMLVCTLYILIGLALTSTIIELVRRQYAESWQHMKELSGRLGELSGPLADHLRRIGEQAGDLNIDVHLMKDLRELRSAIQLSKLESLARLDPKLKNDARIAELLREHLNSTNENGDSAFLDILDTEPLRPEPKKRKVIQVVIYESSV